MSIATVVTRGYGSFGSVNKLPTLGYDIAAVAEITPRFHTLFGAQNNNASLRNTTNLSSTLLGAQNNNTSLRGNEG